MQSKLQQARQRNKSTLPPSICPVECLKKWVAVMQGGANRLAVCRLSEANAKHILEQCTAYAAIAPRAFSFTA